MIRVPDPSQIAVHLAKVRTDQGLTRRQVARHIGHVMFRNDVDIANQLRAWEALVKAPNVTSLGPWLDALAYDLALVRRPEPEPHCESCGGPCRDESDEGEDLALVPREGA